jgi:replicative DNA helicase
MPTQTAGRHLQDDGLLLDDIRLHDKQAEIASIGSLIHGYHWAMIDKGTLTSADFGHPACRTVFEALVALRETDTPIDLVVVCTYLRTRVRSDEVTPMNLLILQAYGIEGCPIPMSSAYINTVLEASVRRKFHAMAVRIIQVTTTGDINELPGALQRLINEVHWEGGRL